MSVKTRRGFLIVLSALLVMSCAFLFAACGNGADKTDLNARIEYVQTTYADNDDSVYTSASWTALQNALSAAVSVNEDDGATQDEVDDALANLNAAVDGLTKASSSVDTGLALLTAWLEAVGDNYTVNVSDYKGGDGSPAQYKAYYTQTSRYSEKTQSGVTAYDGYIHEWSYDGDGEVKMGGVYFKTNGSPMVYLFDDEMWRAGNAMSYGLAIFKNESYLIDSAYDFVDGDGSGVYSSTNENAIEIFAMTALSGYDFDTQLKNEIRGVSLELVTEGAQEYLRVCLYGDTAADNVLTYTVTGVGTTVIDKIEEYKTANPDYETEGKPRSVLSDLDTLLSVEGRYGVKFDVYTSGSQGLDGAEPEWSVSAVYDDNGNQYWYTTYQSRGLVNLTDGMYNVTIQDGAVTLGDKLSDYTMEDINFGKFVISNYSDFVLRDGTDEYYIDLSQNEGLAQFLVRFFDIVDMAKPEKIAAVSISENVNGDLVLTLWQTFSTSTHPNREGVLLRAVLTDYSDFYGTEYTVAAFEDYFDNLQSLEALQDLIAEATSVTQQSDYASQYTEASRQALEAALAAAREVAASQSPAAQQISAASSALESAINGMKKVATAADVASLDNAITHAEMFTEANYTQASYAALETVVTAARQLKESAGYTKEDVDAAVAAINAAIEGLVEVTDTSALDALISECDGITGETYTAESFNAFTAALTNAQNVDENATQEQIDRLYNDLLTAKNNLLEKADISGELQTAYNGVESVNNDDGQYTAESYAAFDAVRSYVKDILDNNTEISLTESQALVKMLNSRHSELESVSFETNGTTSGSIQTWIDDMFFGGMGDGLGEMIGDIVSGYTYTVSDGSINSAYIYKTNKYFYSTAENKGYIVINGLVYDFTIDSGEVVLGTAYYRQAQDYFATYLSHVAAVISYPDTQFVRIGNGNEWFSTDTDWLDFIYGIDGAYGFSLIFDGDALTVKVYDGMDVIAPSDGVSALQAAAAGRTDVICTVTFSDIGTAGNTVIDGFISGYQVTAQNVVDALDGISSNYTIVSHEDGSMIYRTENYYFNGDYGYILKNGQVRELYFIEGEYKVGGLVYVDGVVADSISDVVPDFTAVKQLSAADWETAYNDFRYVPTDENSTIGGILAQIVGVSGSSVGVSVINDGTLQILQGANSFRPSGVFTVTAVGSTTVEKIEALLS